MPLANHVELVTPLSTLWERKRGQLPTHGLLSPVVFNAFRCVGFCACSPTS